jgi:hypothetical protein
MFVLAVCPTVTDPKAIVCVDALSVPVAGLLPVVAGFVVVDRGAVQPDRKMPNINAASSSTLARFTCLIIARKIGLKRLQNGPKVTIYGYLCWKVYPGIKLLRMSEVVT